MYFSPDACTCKNGHPLLECQYTFMQDAVCPACSCFTNSSPKVIYMYMHVHYYYEVIVNLPYFHAAVYVMVNYTSRVHPLG